MHGACTTPDIGMISLGPASKPRNALVVYTNVALLGGWYMHSSASGILDINCAGQIFSIFASVLDDATVHVLQPLNMHP